MLSFYLLYKSTCNSSLYRKKRPKNRNLIQSVDLRHAHVAFALLVTGEQGSPSVPVQYVQDIFDSDWLGFEDVLGSSLEPDPLPRRDLLVPLFVLTAIILHWCYRGLWVAALPLVSWIIWIQVSQVKLYTKVWCYMTFNPHTSTLSRGRNVTQGLDLYSMQRKPFYMQIG